MTKPIANWHVFWGQSNDQCFSTYGLPYYGGWTADNGIIIWKCPTPTIEVYNPCVNSSPLGGPCWGPEGEYARRERLLSPARDVYIHKYDPGGVGMATQTNPSTNDWSPFCPHGASPIPLKSFVKACDDLQAAIDFLAPYRTSVIDSLVWIGNESDTFSQSDATAIMRDLPMFIRAFRARFAAYGGADTKCIINRIKNESPNGAYAPEVQDAQDFAGTLRRNATVNTDDLTYTAGHYIPSDVVVLGGRFHDAKEAISE